MGSDHALPAPPLRLDHLDRLTDCTGIIQHAYHAVPDPHFGYSIDDQARALIVVLNHTRLAGLPRSPRAAFTYLSYLRHALNPDGTFHNFLSYDRRWRDERGSNDAQGRALWSLAYAARYAREQAVAQAALDLFDHGLRQAQALEAPRAWAFTLVALYHRLQIQPDAALLDLVHDLAERLVTCYEAAATDSWQWFEVSLTYCNGKLPLALLLAQELTGETRYRAIALESLQWLTTVLFDGDGTLRLVGQNGWYHRGSVKARFDEQCVDAQGTVEVALAAYRLTGDPTWRDRALAAFAWFHGRNVHGLPLIDPQTWGCYDGLTAGGVNANMGAESILCYLLAYLDLVDAGLLTLEGI
jgi:hypothetical protein